MDTSIFLAQAFGLYMLIIGLALLINGDDLKEKAESMVSNPGVMFLTAIMTLILGILAVLFHNIWVPGWPVLVTILAWITLLKGLLRLFVPGIEKSAIKMMQNDVLMRASIAVSVILGVVLCYYGFIAQPSM